MYVLYSNYLTKPNTLKIRLYGIYGNLHVTNTSHIPGSWQVIFNLTWTLVHLRIPTFYRAVTLIYDWKMTVPSPHYSHIVFTARNA
jgi:hypothetical protein